MSGGRYRQPLSAAEDGRKKRPFRCTVWFGEEKFQYDRPAASFLRRLSVIASFVSSRRLPYGVSGGQVWHENARIRSIPGTTALAALADVGMPFASGGSCLGSSFGMDTAVSGDLQGA
jgi:hypothetical protein